MRANDNISNNIRRGFQLLSRNWQLVVIQIAMGIVIFLAALVFIALPLGALMMAMGIDGGSHAGGLKEALLGKAADPVGLATRSIAALLLLIVSGSVFMLFAIGLSSFVLGGSAGVLLAAASNSARFRFEEFLSEGRRLFSGVLWFTLTAFMIAVLLLCVFGLTAAIGMAAYKAAGIAGTMTGVFVATAGWLLLVACAGFFFFYLYMLVLQGTVIIAHENPGALAAFRRAYAFIEQDSGGRGLILWLTGGYLGIEIALGFLGAGLDRIPGVGQFISLPYQIGANLMGAYLGLCVLSGLVAYYNDAVVQPAFEDAIFKELEDIGQAEIPDAEAPIGKDMQVSDIVADASDSPASGQAEDSDTSQVQGLGPDQPRTKTGEM